jgi:hypothetical protein
MPEDDVQRDSFLGEKIVWESGPSVVRTPPMFLIGSALAFASAAISVAYAIVIGLVLERAPTESMLFALWCVTLGFAARHLPVLWQQKVRYEITEKHVVYRRGPFRRTIERSAISFARIYWHAGSRAVGDLELVRAVPTGALRRRLMLRLDGLAAPDRVWAIVRGAQSGAPVGEADRPLAQRLDVGERVCWSARPRPSWRAYLPQGPREWAIVALAVFLLFSAARMIWQAVPAVQNLVANGMPARSLSMVALVFALSASIAIVVAVAAFLVYAACIRPGYLIHHTRYLITNRRVLIQRDHEELHLDRSRIVDVIDTPAGGGLSDVFLVLDGPRARALAASGAFGEMHRGSNLRPVLRALEDVEGVVRALSAAPESQAA